jgi:NAD(P)-dependent dehydrogenase (short-subunit alcohol dehydrogenase family)
LGDKNRWQEVLKNFPIGRAGRPEEVAHLAAFLASDHASYISGEGVRVDAGLRVRSPAH